MLAGVACAPHGTSGAVWGAPRPRGRGPVVPVSTAAPLKPLPHVLCAHSEPERRGVGLTCADRSRRSALLLDDAESDFSCYR